MSTRDSKSPVELISAMIVEEGHPRQNQMGFVIFYFYNERSDTGNERILFENGTFLFKFPGTRNPSARRFLPRKLEGKFLESYNKYLRNPYY